ncbi:MAG: hypothetical protein K2Q01_04195, partial [Rickettsiales bacterium]|nr:hypothetical protein [Rickettsiales bacterium]
MDVALDGGHDDGALGLSARNTQLALLLIFLACMGITAAWVAENPGSVTMYWFDYRIDTSFALILLVTLAAAFLLTFLYILIFRLIHAPDTLLRRRSLKAHEKGLAELTHSIVALAAADSKAAETHTRKAEKLLGRTPLTLLLSAQVARTQGDDARTQLLLTQMLEHKETEYLAARYLSESATKQHHLTHAREMAVRANKLHPGGLEALLSLHIRLGEWQQAIVAITSALRKGKITRHQLHRYSALVHAQHAIQLMEEGQDETALAVARHALKELPAFLPVVETAARAYVTNQQSAKALKLVMAAWKTHPQTTLAELFRKAAATLPKEKQLKLARKMAAQHPQHYASHILMAQAHIALAHWREARDELKKALTPGDTTLACRLMAEVELGEYSDYDAHGRWLTRSSAARGESLWLCNACGHGGKHWAAHCPSCH